MFDNERTLVFPSFITFVLLALFATKLALADSQTLPFKIWNKSQIVKVDFPYQKEFVR